MSNKGLTTSTNQRKKLAIIDGKSVFYRGYYAMPNLSTKDGTPTGGVYGFAAMALELIKRLKPDYVCVAWDKPKTNIRKRLAVYPGYKAGRKPAPPDFYVQIPILHELLEAFNWPLYELDDYEADDIMCGLAKKAEKQGIETLLITSDLDALQCVGPLTHVYALKKGLTNIELFKPESFTEKYGIDVHQFLDLKSLKGDSSDNIPGVPGIGEKTAIELLKTYKTLDNIYDNLALIKDSVSKKLAAGKDSAYLSKEVATLYDDAPIELDLEEMDVNKLDTARLAAILKQLEFRTLLRNLPEGMQNAQVDSIAPIASLHDLKVPKLVHVTDDKSLAAVSVEAEVVIQARSRGKHGKDPSLLLIADSETCFAIDLTKVNAGKYLPGILAGHPAVGYDLKSSFKVLLELGVPLPKVEHDVLIGAFIVNSLRREQTLTDLASSDLSYEAELDNLDDEQFVVRAPEIAAVVRALAVMQGEQISELTSLIKLVQDVEWPVIPVLARMEWTGIKLDCNYLNGMSEELSDQISDIEQEIYGHAGKEFNISSPSQLADILFETLGLPTAGVKKGKTGYSTAANELDKLRALHPIINLITSYREFTKLKNTYVDTLPTMVDDRSRVHTTFSLTVAQTGRLSSNDPNLQNIPVRTELGKRIRTAFVADKGTVLISADYSQFELRLAAVLSGDQGMIEAFNNDEDIHQLTAAAVHGIDPKEVTKQQRYQAKAVNFGILYGQGPHGLAEGTGMSFSEAREFIARYFEIRPKLKEYIDATREKAKTKGYVETLLGRRRPTPDVHSSNFAVREGAYRAAVNMPVQGTAADLTKLAMTRLDEAFAGHKLAAKQLLQIHDAILVESPKSEADTVAKVMKETMEQVYPELGVHLRVDVSTGTNWGEL